ncbi:MAG: MMPL family transporter, partial [Frankiaceae bacterium]|nr:MMPL family transporter [Frankiaceae bacterium]
MRRIAEFVLRHRRWVLVAWLLTIVIGGALVQKTNDRLVIDFSLPGQPGTETANQIDQEFHAGGKTAPYVLTVTMPQGQTVSGNEQAIGKTFASIQQDVPDVRVLDEANTADKAFRTSDDRTAYALVFYRFL